MLEINKIYNIDCVEGYQLLDNDSIDLIFTDPPYLKEFLYTYDYLANFSPRVMKDVASLLTIVGHYALSNILEKFNNKLKYRWTYCMWQKNGAHARMAMGIEVLWKPILLFVKRAYPSRRGFLRDGIEIIESSGQSKKLHKWQQSNDWCEYYIQKLTKEGDLVLDPYMGSGTVAEVCKKNNRNYIGFEINKEYFDIANERMINVDGRSTTNR